MPRYFRIVLIAFLLVSGSSFADRNDKQREQFLKAESALKSGHSQEFRQLKKALADYPLHGYLEYWELSDRLDTAKPAQVEAFLQRYRGQPIAARLRASWLYRLGKRKDWEEYLHFYTPQGSVTLQCYEIRARLQEGDREQALQAALQLWLAGHSQPDACDPAFDQLYADGVIDSGLIWQRIRLAFARQKSSLAGFLAKRLSAEDREWVKRWQHAHRRPTSAIKQAWAKQDTPLVREILVHALQRLARHKPEQAWKHWQQLSATHKFRRSSRAQYSNGSRCPARSATTRTPRTGWPVFRRRRPMPTSASGAYAPRCSRRTGKARCSGSTGSIAMSAKRTTGATGTPGHWPPAGPRAMR